MKRGLSTIGILGVISLFAMVVFGLAVGWGGSANSRRAISGDLYAVVRGAFDVSIQTSGELAAQNQINIYNELESNAVIIELVDEGTFVSDGDVLLRLNDDTIKNEIRDAELAVTAAKNDLSNVRANLAIAEKRRDSELSVKQLDIDLADLALQAWREGEVVAKRQQLTLAVQTAEKNHERLFKKYESSVNLYEQKFLSKDELDQDEISLLNADATLKKAKLDVIVYEQYTHKQQKQKKESDLQQSKDELDRATERFALEINSFRATIGARENQLASREEKLQKRSDQLEMCVVRSPANGMVVYATSMGDRRNEGEPLKVGKSLWRNELVMTIPDTTKMKALVKVNEALSGLVTKGQVVTITCDAVPDVTFRGAVLSVGVLARGGGWRDPNRRDYTVEIAIENPEEYTLKPSMRCTAEIFVERVENELYVPIHSIHRDSSIIWVWVEVSGGFMQREVTPGRFSNSYVAITSGLEEGDVVHLGVPVQSKVIRSHAESIGE